MTSLSSSEGTDCSDNVVRKSDMKRSRKSFTLLARCRNSSVNIFRIVNFRTLFPLAEIRLPKKGVEDKEGLRRLPSRLL